MPVKSTDAIMNLPRLDYFNFDMHLFDNPITEPLLSDDIWKKFELDFPEFSGFEDVFKEIPPPRPEGSSSLFPLLDDNCEIRNHDCMWAGHCGSKEHDDTRQHANCFASPAPPDLHRPTHAAVAIKKHKPFVGGQQSLLKPAVRAAATALPPSVHVPQTPPMSDDEEGKSKPTKVLQILNEAISECDFDEDSDLCEYFEDEDEDLVEVKLEDKEEAFVEIMDEVKQQNVWSYKYAAENDHSYHKGNNPAIRSMEHLGIETPSDSEEEIDVVNVVEKLNFNNKVLSLPNNPSTRDRQQIQRRVATAISKKRMTNTAGIKTILPVRKSSHTPETSMSVKRKASTPADNRGNVKRARQYRTGIGSPYKKRGYGNSSDDEPEPSEKRSLHNNMERQRRIDLRNAFEDLRLLVPEVSKKERAAKVVILREASQYCDFLTKSSHNYSKHMEDLKRHQDWLRSRVSQLRRSLAAKR